MSACGGGSPTKGSSSATESVDPETGGTADTVKDVTSASGRNVTFLPLSILETSSDYSGFEDDNIYRTQRDYPYISKYLVSVFDSTTLTSTAGIIDDFLITENGTVVDPLESFPILQPIGAIPTYLHTAIVIDVSNSVKATVGLNPIITETKEMITAMKASSDSVIANQRFSIWAFGRNVQEITSGFTADATALNSALDSILTVDVKEGSNLKQAIIEAIGNYNGEGGDGSNGDFAFRDSGSTNNDLIEEVNTDRIQLSSLILITSGSDNLNVFEDDQVKTALESQSQVIFDTATSSGAGTVSATKNFGKPFITVLVGNDAVTSVVITNNASNVINLKKVTGELDYAAQVVSFQTKLITQRKRESDRNVLRYASPLRQGTHEGVLSTSAVDFKYSLTHEIKFQAPQTVGMPSEVYIPQQVTSVEIVGENNQYLQNVININNTNTFYPATRWTSNQFAISDYVWQLNGAVQSSDLTTGAVTIDPASISSSSILSLTNNAISETKNIQLTAGASSGILIYDHATNQPLDGQSIARADIVYVDLNEPDPAAEVDPDAAPIVPDEVYSVAFQDYNTPLESYQYALSLPSWTAYDASAPEAPFDYKLFGNRIQIQKSSIDALGGSITITAANTTLVTSTSFTITL
jgi:hypothetical protein